MGRRGSGEDLLSQLGGDNHQGNAFIGRHLDGTNGIFRLSSRADEPALSSGLGEQHTL